MTTARSQNRADSLVGWVASMLFAALAGYAFALVAGMAVATAGTIVCLAAGLFVLSKVAPGDGRSWSIEPLPFDEVIGSQDELLLDDPLPAPSEHSRVVRLFAVEERSPAALVARIEDYLGRDSDRGAAIARAAEAPKPVVDASAALHAALSNIRASLR